MQLSAAKDDQIASDGGMTDDRTRTGAATYALIRAIERRGLQLSYEELLLELHYTVKERSEWAGPVDIFEGPVDIFGCRHSHGKSLLLTCFTQLNGCILSGCSAQEGGAEEADEEGEAAEVGRPAGRRAGVQHAV